MKLNEVYKNSGLGKWFHGESANKTPGWDRYNSEGKLVGECGDAKKGEAYSACLSKQKAQKLGKKGIANFVNRKRAAQSAAGRGEKGSGDKGKKPIFVETGASKKRKVEEQMKNINEGCGCGKPHPKGCQCDKCKGEKKSLFEKIKTKLDKTLTEEAPLGKPFRTPGGPKKFGVRVKNEKGNIITVRFGDPNMEIKRDDPARRSNFRARHNCASPGPRTKARYWSCRMWERGKSVSQLTKECMDFTELDLTPYRGKKIIVETTNEILYGKLGIHKNNFAIFEDTTVKKVLEPSEITKIVCEGTTVLILEKNKPNDPQDWSDCKSQAKRKFDVYPSAYANAWASKCYKKKGGTWRKVDESVNLQEKVLKRGDKWVVTNKAGEKVLGTHSTKSKAMRQLKAIEVSKHMKESTDLIIQQKLKEKFFNKIHEEIVNSDNVGKLTPQNSNPRAKRRDKIAKGLGNVNQIKGDSPEEARHRLATFIELSKNNKNK